MNKAQLTDRIIVNRKHKHRLPRAVTDIILLGFVMIAVFVLSYRYNAFMYLVNIFQNNAKAVTFIDEIISCLLTLCLGSAIFAWRRWLELKREMANHIKLQKQLIAIAETKAETSDIICSVLRSELEYYRKQNE